MTVAVFTKDLQATTFQVDTSPDLITGETLITATTVQLSPATVPALAFGTLVVASPIIGVPCSGGTDGTSYGGLVRCTTSTGRVFDKTVAVLVINDLTVPYATRNPYSFQNLLGSLAAGDAGIGKALFVLDANVDASTGYVTWELMDRQGAVFASGNAYDYKVTQDSFRTIVEANAVVNIPTDVVPTLSDQSYQLRWALVLNGVADQYAFESVEVLGATTVPQGPSSTVELAGDAVQLQLVVDRQYPLVEFAAYRNNTPLTSHTRSSNPKRVAGGWFYEALFDTSDTATWQASLDPYSILWRYKDSADLSYQRETGRMWLIFPSMFGAIEDVQATVSKARTTIDGAADMLFDPVTVMTWLRRGRDAFNAAGGIITEFNMTNATGQVREFWLKYAEIAALRAQYLAEGEKAFNFSGQAISLDVDRTQYYEQLASNILADVQDSVATLKKNLTLKGISGGDGNVAGALGGGVPGAMGCVGIGLNAVSPNFPWIRPGYGRY